MTCRKHAQHAPKHNDTNREKHGTYLRHVHEYSRVHCLGLLAIWPDRARHDLLCRSKACQGTLEYSTSWAIVSLLIWSR